MYSLIKCRNILFTMPYRCLIVFVILGGDYEKARLYEWCFPASRLVELCVNKGGFDRRSLRQIRQLFL